jgi:hypothetical protein
MGLLELECSCNVKRSFARMQIKSKQLKHKYIQTNRLSELVLNVNTCVHDLCCFDVALFIHNASSNFTKVQLLASTAFADDKGSCLQLPNKDTKDQRLLSWRK